ncbi:hypothetical protein [Novosphingobium taihuense]|uniref:Heavy-metal resistance protein n=1 Tax=Novosphingobium taihuense TaxID=260085 RepID=A0A7W7EVM5_9SPHN|nr:hypothetical protein [Novosphingobium taihuense]MBB4615211.1 hypothetical protein [Novosphingobium taihuense]TWH84246.1 hypothetical protein IQ25_02672 [Novosphingobium taihuense]
MRKTIIATALSAMLATGFAAAPAMAHDNDRYPGNNRAEAAYLTPARNAEIRRDIWQLDNRIARAQRNRAISPREAQGLRRDVQNLKFAYNRSANRGLSAGEYRHLERKVSQIQYRLQVDRRDRDGRRG